ncbi:TVP38/TMEM64 family protein [Paludifilum halophilum]|uniref:TVP38/TMEM64 family membrane protein n=1 Tax=Paludifilum halophilum TaxID=1642702 RepID=A0A235B2I3_9BACL|nr:TVP38/TMEM64 family protein [Paludifilum halophilum]OYD06169.1 hypothetical protein CHM34_17630 [Paludifilum halophilum]
MKRNGIKLIGFVLLLTAGFFILRSLGLERLTPGYIRHFILSFGMWAPFLYIFLYTIRPLFFFPAVALTLSGGMAFGPWWGTLYDLIGASLGAYLAFGLARSLGREAIQQWWGKRLQMLNIHVETYGFRAVLFLRLLPMVPFDAISYSSGLSKIRFRDFAWATTLGMIPGTFAYNFLGHSLHHAFSTTFYIALGLVFLFMLSPVIYKKWKKRSSSL